MPKVDFPKLELKTEIRITEVQLDDYDTIISGEFNVFRERCLMVSPDKKE